MIYYIFKDTNPYFNIAAEEYLLKNENIKDDILILWQNKNTIVIGCNQNAHAEINIEECNKNGVHVVRRITGGGAVFHDEGNLNFSYILKNNTDLKPKDYEKILQPVINALKELGLNAHFSGKNDIEIDNKKISGNSQYIYKNTLLHHGTLLFDVDLSKIKNYLIPNKKKMESKGISSNAARVTNILPLLSKPITMTEFKSHLVKSLIGSHAKEGHLTNEDINKINDIKKHKFDLWEWNFGKQGHFLIQKDHRIEGKGSVQFNANVENGIIKDVKFFGDYLGNKGTKDIENKLIGHKFDYNEVKKILNLNEIKLSFGPLFEIEDILQAIFSD